MSNIHQLSLDIKKSGETLNDPVVLRTGDSDDSFKVYVKSDGQPFNASKATFYATKPDKTIIAGDAANVNGNVITYSVPSQLVAVAGYVKNAYFLINGTISTESFEIKVLDSVDFDGDSTNLIPGLNGLTDKLNDIVLKWNSDIDSIGTQVDNLDVNKVLVDKVNAAVEDAKKDYLNDFNKSVADLNAVIKDLSDKETTLTAKSGDLDKAVSNVNDQITTVNSWLTTVQNNITAANAEFIKDQQDSVDADIAALKKTISDTQTLADTLSGQVEAIKKSVDSINIPKINADTQTALDNSKTAETDASKALDQLNGSDNWQKQKIFEKGSYYLKLCPNTTSFDEFLKSDAVPIGFSIIRDANFHNLDWSIIKESSTQIYGSAVSNDNKIYFISINNGTFSGYNSQDDQYANKADTTKSIETLNNDVSGLKPLNMTKADFAALATKEDKFYIVGDA